MSIKFFDIRIPVNVVETDPVTMEPKEGTGHVLTVRITTGPHATAQDAVDELARKLESTLNTIDIGDCE